MTRGNPGHSSVALSKKSNASMNREAGRADRAGRFDGGFGCRARGWAGKANGSTCGWAGGRVGHTVFTTYYGLGGWAGVRKYWL